MVLGGARVLGVAGAAAVAAPALHLGVLTAAGAKPHRCGRTTSTRFAIVVPAHDEAESIGATLESLATLDYPADRRHIVVVADNCTDDTAEIARKHDVTVLERFNDDERGKGYALDFAFGQLLADPDVDAFVVIDADTTVDRHLLACASFHIEQGASAIQVDYRVRNPETSWRTRLLDVAFTAKHLIRGRGRDALGCSIGLHGNGMIFARELLSTIPYAATSVVEDIEYGMMLVDAGRIVEWCDGTHVAGDMPGDADSAVSQRVRWELGHAEMRDRYGWAMLLPALRTGDHVRADAAIDVLTPPLGTVVGGLAGATLVGGVARRWLGSAPLRVVTLGWLALGFHVVMSIGRSPSSWRALPAIARVPWYLAWKVGVRTSSVWQTQARDGAVWTRTERSDAAQDSSPDLVVTS